jgi:heme A synthase
MLGFADIWVALAYLLSILSTLLCIIYGWIHWNDDDVLPDPVHPKNENLDFEDAV